MVGGIEEVIAKAEKIAKESAAQIINSSDFLSLSSSITTEIILSFCDTSDFFLGGPRGPRFSGFCFYNAIRNCDREDMELRPTCQTPTLDALLCHIIKGVKRQTCIFYFEFILRMLVTQIMRGCLCITFVLNTFWFPVFACRNNVIFSSLQSLWWYMHTSKCNFLNL